MDEALPLEKPQRAHPKGLIRETSGQKQQGPGLGWSLCNELWFRRGSDCPAASVCLHRLHHTCRNRSTPLRRRTLQVLALQQGRREGQRWPGGQV